MNKAILIGRLTRDPEVFYTQSSDPIAIAKYTLAIDRPYKQNGEKKADFIRCVALGRKGEFAEKWLKKGMKIAVEGSIQTGSYTDKDGIKRYSTEVNVDSQEFVESRRSFEENQSNQSNPSPKDIETDADGFVKVDDFDDDDLPF